MVYPKNRELEIFRGGEKTVSVSIRVVLHNCNTGKIKLGEKLDHLGENTDYSGHSIF